MNGIELVKSFLLAVKKAERIQSLRSRQLSCMYSIILCNCDITYHLLIFPFTFWSREAIAAGFCSNTSAMPVTTKQMLSLFAGLQKIYELVLIYKEK